MSDEIKNFEDNVERLQQEDIYEYEYATGSGGEDRIEIRPGAGRRRGSGREQDDIGRKSRELSQEVLQLAQVIQRLRRSLGEFGGAVEDASEQVSGFSDELRKEKRERMRMFSEMRAISGEMRRVFFDIKGVIDEFGKAVAQWSKTFRDLKVGMAGQVKDVLKDLDENVQSVAYSVSKVKELWKKIEEEGYQSFDEFGKVTRQWSEAFKDLEIEKVKDALKDLGDDAQSIAYSVRRVKELWEKVEREGYQSYDELVRVCRSLMEKVREICTKEELQVDQIPSGRVGEVLKDLDDDIQSVTYSVRKVREMWKRMEEEGYDDLIRMRRRLIEKVRERWSKEEFPPVQVSMGKVGQVREVLEWIGDELRNLFRRRGLVQGVIWDPGVPGPTGPRRPMRPSMVDTGGQLRLLQELKEEWSDIILGTAFGPLAGFVKELKEQLKERFAFWRERKYFGQDDVWETEIPEFRTPRKPRTHRQPRWLYGLGEQFGERFSFLKQGMVQGREGDELRSKTVGDSPLAGFVKELKEQLGERFTLWRQRRDDIAQGGFVKELKEQIGGSSSFWRRGDDGVQVGFVGGGSDEIMLKDVVLIQERDAAIEAEKVVIKAGSVEEVGGGLDLFGGLPGRGLLSRVSGLFRRLGGRVGILGILLGAGLAGYMGFREGGIGVGLAKGGGALGGGLLGVKIGGLVGTAIAPGVGTAIGGLLGGLVGMFGGEKLAGAVYEGMKKLIQDREWVASLQKGWSSFIDELRNLFLSAVTKIRDAIMDVKGWLGEKFDALIEGVKNLFSDLFGGFGTVIKDVGNKIRTNVIEPTKNAFEQFRKSVGEAWKSVTGFVSRYLETGEARAEEAAVVASPFKTIGMYQFTPAMVKEFLRRYGYEKEFEGLEIGSKKFVEKWRELVKRDKGFVIAQQRFAEEEYLYPGLKFLKQLGFTDEQLRSRALREMVMARMVHGPAVFRTAVKKVVAGMKPEEIAKMSVEEFIQKVYGELWRGRERYFRREFGMGLRKGIEARLEKERQLVLSMAEGEPVFGDVVNKQNQAQKKVMEVEVQKQRTVVEEMSSIVKSLVNRPEGGERRTQVFAGGGEAFQRIGLSVDDLGVLLLQMGLV